MLSDSDLINSDQEFNSEVFTKQEKVIKIMNKINNNDSSNFVNHMKNKLELNKILISSFPINEAEKKTLKKNILKSDLNLYF